MQRKRAGTRAPRTRKNSLLLAALLLLTAGTQGCFDGKDRFRDPNLVLVVIDALRPDHVGAYGCARRTTPHIDRFAEEAVLFETVIAPAAFTLPSVATLFTGMDPIHHGVRRHMDPQGIEDRLDENLFTLAERLKARGYSTAAVVSNSLFQLDTGFDQGFDLFDAGRRRDAGPTTDAALAYLEKVSRDAPFFLWIHYIDPHWPYDAPRDFERPFSHPDGGQFPDLVRAFEQGRVRGDQIYFDHLLSPDGILRGIAEYDNEVAYVDQQLERVFLYLKEKGLFEESLIALVSDHGESLGEHGLTFAHSFTLYDEIEKAVWIVKPPGWKEGLRHKEQVRLLDFLPTTAGCLGLPPPPECQGVDLSPLWKGGAKPPSSLAAYAETEPRYRNRRGGFRYPSRKRIYGEGDEAKWRMIRTEAFKLIRVPGEGMELYDLSLDPMEERNILEERPGAAEPLIRMLEEMDAEDEGAPLKGKKPLTTDDEDGLRLLREMGY